MTPSRFAAFGFLLAVAGCQADSPSPAVTSDPDRVRTADVSILFVGNSHTRGHALPELVCGMVRHLRPVATTYAHVCDVSFLEESAHDGRCKAEVESRPWTHVVLQAQKISVSGKFDYSRAEGIELARLAKGRGANVVFYPEWGLRGVPGDGPRQEKVYREMARDAGVGVAPVARAWDVALAGRADLPLYEHDGNHQTAVGAFLTAAVLAGSLTGEDPAKLADFDYTAVDAATRAFLLGSATKALAADRAEATKESPSPPRP